ncbi:glutathione S-transferase 1-like [Lineus longissimus]|uniref:glutathione S-transferase 1-like n=1 Tax=Lineus longissimus TaxID=88925 RepID=UPI002B4F1FCA
MPQYVLHYFNMMGLAEPIRLAFALAGVEYEDKRYSGDEWKQFKPSTPVGQMPVLEVDGKMLSQSGAILRYVGSEYGLSGKDIWEKAKVDEALGIIDDIVIEMVKMRFAKDAAIKEQARKSFLEKAPPLLKALEKLLEVNGSGFYAGPEVTIADLKAFHILRMVTDGNADLLADMPKVAENITKVGTLPNIKEWVEKRPPTVM